MGSLTEERYYAQFMPEQFKQCCPCCKQPWTFETIEWFGYRTSIQCTNGCFHFCRTQHFVSNQLTTAWQKLWRSMVQTYGVRRSVEMCQ